ncbi:MAG: apolipoprotein N-acyltransferase [Rhodospirillales bacterium]
MERLQRTHAWLAGLEGRRRWAAAFLFGVLAMLALPPVYAVFLLIPAAVGLLWLIDSGRSRRAVFAVGWWFGFGYFVAGLYWIGIALWIKAAQFGWLIPFAVLGLPACLAVYIGAVAVLTRVLAPTPGIGRVLVFAAAWTALEWIRGWALTGFPWNLIGTAWAFSDSMIQLSALTGIYGLSLVTMAAAAMPAVLIMPGRAARRAVLAAAVLLGGVWLGGAVRLAGADDSTVAGVRLRLVQPNIAQEMKWQPELRAAHVMQQLHMSRRSPAPGSAPPTHVIWSETAVPYNLAIEPRLQNVIGDAVPDKGLIITGAPRTTPPGVEPYRVWNSLHALDPRGSIVATYDKSHLVPFGEYVPLRGILTMAKVTPGMTDFSRGTGPRTIRLDGLPPVSPLICYEGIFPGRVISDSDTRPHWLLNITNDAWYGRSAGPYQHFAAVRFRAAEEGMPLVRVANTGISAIVDSYGRVTARLGLGKAGVVDGGLPKSLVVLTPYARFGDWFVWGLMIVTGGGGVWLSRRKRSAFAA